jgi:hypothetical protein
MVFVTVEVGVSGIKVLVTVGLSVIEIIEGL